MNAQFEKQGAYEYAIIDGETRAIRKWSHRYGWGCWLSYEQARAPLTNEELSALDALSEEREAAGIGA